MTGTGRLILSAALAFLAACGGVFVGRALLSAPPPPGAELHEILHHHLALDSRQSERLAALEGRFSVQRSALELEIRAANARLAEAIEVERGNGPRVTAAIDQSHAAMGELQKATLAHVFAMRRLLRPDQTKAFDAAVVKALTDEQH